MLGVEETMLVVSDSLSESMVIGEAMRTSGDYAMELRRGIRVELNLALGHCITIGRAGSRISSTKFGEKQGAAAQVCTTIAYSCESLEDL